MPDRDFAERLDAVERALTDDDADLTDLREAATLSRDVARLEERLASLEASVEELEAGLQAVRGYTGNVRAVNRDVERRASAALAKAEALEGRVRDRDPRQTDRRSTPDGGHSGTQESPDAVGPATDRPHERPRTGGGGREPAAREAGSDQGPVPREADSDDARDRRPACDDDVAGERDGDDGTEQFIERVRDAL